MSMNKSKQIDVGFISLLLFLGFALFYILQIPRWTSNADVLVYACRSGVHAPILKYAFLDGRSLLGLVPQANYHLGHTIILWAVYHLMPASLANTIWPAGLVSAVSGAFVVVLTYLIALKLQLARKQALWIAIFAGLIPSLWYHSLIGEVYMLQLFAILLFVYLFLCGKVLLSALAFFFANLVSPLSGLAFSFIFLAGLKKTTIKNGFIVGAVALALFLAVYYLIGSNIMTIFRPLEMDRPDRAILYRIVMLGAFVVLNINFFLIYLFIGGKKLFKNYRSLAVLLIVGILPQFLLLFASSTLFVELGSFQLPIFWALAFPVGIALAESKKRLYPAIAFVGLLLIVLSVWMLPAQSTGNERYAAGQWLQEVTSSDVKIIGDWGSSIGVTLSYLGWDFEKLSTHYFDRGFPTDEDLQATGEDSLIIVSSKKPVLRELIARLPIPGVAIDRYDPEKSITIGSIKHIYENSALRIYLWKSDVFDSNGQLVLK